jgi:glycosyltransferase involved in cell wall biosynthesis
VACRAGAIEEALPPECGVLVEPGLYEETRLAQALAQLLGEPEKRAAMGRQGRNFVAQHHSLDETRRGYRALLEEIDRLEGKSYPASISTAT